MSPPNEDPTEHLRRRVAETLADQLNHASFDWSALARLDRPVLRIEACLEEGSHAARESTPKSAVITQLIDLSDVASTCSSPHKATSELTDTPHKAIPSGDTARVPISAPAAGHISSLAPRKELKPKGNVTAEPSEPSPDENSDNSDLDSPTEDRRKELGGLRPARQDSTTLETADSQRQIHSGDKFPKRRKLKPVGHFLQPSTLDKLIGGIWEQIHGSLSLDPQSLLGQSQLRSLGAEDGAVNAIAAPMALARTGAKDPNGRTPQSDEAFSRSNVFCRQVTQASRACRSLEVIVQARWVEYFDSYVDSWANANPLVPRSRYNKAALMGACADFGWTEKELRNKMYVWRGYKEIKDAGGWASLVFAGMGIYRFCKYRIGFDKESMQRLRNLQPAIEVAADTLHPQWRQLLTVIGEPSQRAFDGHAHDWVVFLDGSDPIPLRNTYLQWDADFSYRQLDECVVDERVWGCDDPRWQPPTDEIVRATAMPLCETCGKEQSDDPKVNNCYCFPTIFGGGKLSSSPVLVFRTADGKNNGLLALCAFERGAPIGEFVGVITKGLQNVDVMESSTASTNYQIWQGRQGNFTRFVNHSCNANAQYQRFTWLNTQRIVLVSKGIDAGTEITVDYSDKYWKGLDKKCLCGETCCRYKRDETNTDS
ncbi:hypothetical protein JX266_002931 [Neoarthrinium moseri]|nr:hypothetical protein JX266_002931 [Neoarthrinium moseri]